MNAKDIKLKIESLESEVVYFNKILCSIPLKSRGYGDRGRFNPDLVTYGEQSGEEVFSNWAKPHEIDFYYLFTETELRSWAEAIRDERNSRVYNIDRLNRKLVEISFGTHRFLQN